MSINFKITPALANKDFDKNVLEQIVSKIIASNERTFSDNEDEDSEVKRVLCYVWKNATKTLYPLAVDTTLRELKKDLVKENFVELRNMIFFNMSKFAIGAIGERFRNSTGLNLQNIIKTNLEVSCFVLALNVYQIIVDDGKEKVNTADFDDMPARVSPEEVFRLFDNSIYRYNREFMLLMDNVYSDPELRKAIKESVTGPMSVEEAQEKIF